MSEAWSTATDAGTIWSASGSHIWSAETSGWIRLPTDQEALEDVDKEERTSPLIAAYLNTLALQLFPARINCHTGNSGFRTTGEWMKCWGGKACLAAAERADRSGANNKGSTEGPVFLDMKGIPWCRMCWADALERHGYIRAAQRKAKQAWVVTDEEREWWGPACFVRYREEGSDKWKPPASITQGAGGGRSPSPEPRPSRMQQGGKGKPSPKRLALTGGGERSSSIPGREDYVPPTWEPGMTSWWEKEMIYSRQKGEMVLVKMIGFLTPKGQPDAIPIPELKAAMTEAEHTYPKDNDTLIWFKRSTHEPGTHMSISRQVLNKAKAAWEVLEPGATKPSHIMTAHQPAIPPPKHLRKDPPPEEDEWFGAGWEEEDEGGLRWEEEDEEGEEMEWGWKGPGHTHKKTRRGQKRSIWVAASSH